MSDPDEEDSFRLFEVAQFLLQDIILALALLKAHQLQALTLDERFDGFDEAVGHGNGLFGGGKTITQVAAAEGCDASLAGELGHIGIEVHPVDALQFQHDMILSGVERGCGIFSWRVPVGHLFSRIWSNRRLSAIFQHLSQGAATPDWTHTSVSPFTTSGKRTFLTRRLPPRDSLRPAHSRRAQTSPWSEAAAR